MKAISALLGFVLGIWVAIQSRAWAGVEPLSLVPGKYCCEIPEIGYLGCVAFKKDGTYEATGKFRDRDGTARGTWKQVGNEIILRSQKEAGALVGYLTRFRIDEEGGQSLTWLPKIRQDFSGIGGAVVYPRYERIDEKGI